MALTEPRTWRLLDLSLGSAFENLALEEALARNLEGHESEGTLRFWVNPPSVILGRFQNPSAEVNLPFCGYNNIAVARRITGGGAVYHDQGNLNVTILNEPETGSLEDLHRKNSQIVIECIKSLGVEARFLAPNSVMAGDKKVSGAAAAIKSKFSLWHASILVSTDLSMLRPALSASIEESNTRFVRSKRQPTTTLKTELGTPIGLAKVKEAFLGAFEKRTGVGVVHGTLTNQEKEIGRKLAAEKYSTDDWNLRGNHQRETL